MSELKDEWLQLQMFVTADASGRFSEWPHLRTEAARALRALDARHQVISYLQSELALQADELARLKRENAALRTALQQADAAFLLVRQLVDGWYNTTPANEWSEFDDRARNAARDAHVTIAALVAKLPEDLQREFARNAGEQEHQKNCQYCIEGTNVESDWTGSTFVIACLECGGTGKETPNAL